MLSYVPALGDILVAHRDSTAKAKVMGAIDSLVAIQPLYTRKEYETAPGQQLAWYHIDDLIKIYKLEDK